MNHKYPSKMINSPGTLETIYLEGGKAYTWNGNHS